MKARTIAILIFLTFIFGAFVMASNPKIDFTWDAWDAPGIPACKHHYWGIKIDDTKIGLPMKTVECV